jgi:hypothetical protein
MDIPISHSFYTSLFSPEEKEKKRKKNGEKKKKKTKREERKKNKKKKERDGRLALTAILGLTLVQVESTISESRPIPDIPRPKSNYEIFIGLS